MYIMDIYRIYDKTLFLLLHVIALYPAKYRLKRTLTTEF